MHTAIPPAAVDVAAAPLAFAAVDTDLGLSLAAVIVLGVGAQLLANRLRIPMILVLLLVGVASGPDVAALVDPDRMLGDLLFPAVSFAVGILLFEGGLGLRVRDLERLGGVPIIRLVTVGALVTWGIGALAAYYLVGLSVEGAILLGAVVIVSGPTVVLPLLNFARVREPVNAILRWEGIIIDPVGATLALVVLQAIVATETRFSLLGRVISTAGAGVLMGLLGAVLLTIMFERHWVPDELHNPFTLAVLAAAFAGANLLRPESGLFAATALGVAMANQWRVPISHIREFEEDLGTLVIAGLFMVLGARIELAALVEWAPQALGLLAVLVFVARPATVWVSTVRSGLSTRERLYLCCMAPRGIVAAAVSALFALQLTRADQPIEALVPVTFIVIVGTVIIYGLAARPLAVRLHVGRPEPRGVAFIGGSDWAVEIGDVLSNQGVSVLIVTGDSAEADKAASRGLMTYTRRLDAEDLGFALHTVGVAVAIAGSRVEEANAYGVNRAISELGRANVYYLPSHTTDEQGQAKAESRHPFNLGLTQLMLESTLEHGGRIVAVGATEFDAEHMADAITLFIIKRDGRPSVVTTDDVVRPPAGARGIYLLPAVAPNGHRLLSSDGALSEGESSQET